MTLQRMALLGASQTLYNPTDPDATTYIANVEATDGSLLEPAVRQAIDTFFIGCKADTSLFAGVSNFNAMKSAAILGAARTRAGARTPLKSTMATITENGTITGWSYDRKLGLKGNGTNNYLDTGRSANADPLNNHSLGIYSTESGTGVFIGVEGTTARNTLYANSTNLGYALRALAVTNSGIPVSGFTGFFGASRYASTGVQWRVNTSSGVTSEASVSQTFGSILVFCRRDVSTPITFTTARILFYWTGEAVDLGLLRSRLITFQNAINAAIP